MWSSEINPSMETAALANSRVVSVRSSFPTNYVTLKHLQELRHKEKLQLQQHQQQRSEEENKEEEDEEQEKKKVIDLTETRSRRDSQPRRKKYGNWRPRPIREANLEDPDYGCGGDELMSMDVEPENVNRKEPKTSDKANIEAAVEAAQGGCRGSPNLEAKLGSVREELKATEKLSYRKKKIAAKPKADGDQKNGSKPKADGDQMIRAKPKADGDQKNGSKPKTDSDQKNGAKPKVDKDPKNRAKPKADCEWKNVAKPKADRDQKNRTKPKADGERESEGGEGKLLQIEDVSERLSSLSVEEIEENCENMLKRIEKQKWQAEEPSHAVSRYMDRKWFNGYRGRGGAASGGRSWQATVASRKDVNVMWVKKETRLLQDPKV